MAATVTSSAHSSTSGAATSLTFSATVAAGDRLIIPVFARGVVDLTSVTFNGELGVKLGQIQFPQYKIETWGLDAPSITTADVVVTSPSSLKLGAAAISVAGAGSLIGTGLAFGYRRPNTADFSSEMAWVEVGTWHPPALGIAMMVSDLSGQTIANNDNTSLFQDSGVGTTDLHLAATYGDVGGPGGAIVAGWSSSWDLGSSDDWVAMAVSIAFGAGPSIIPPQIVMGRSALASASATVYNGFPRAGGDFTTDSALMRTPALAAGTLTNFMVRVKTAPGGSASRAFTIQKNGSDTLMTATISTSGTVATDTTNAVTVAYGDNLQIKQVPSSTPDAAGAIEWSCDFTPTTAGDCIHGGYANNVVGTISTACYNALLAPIALSAWKATAPEQYRDVVAVPGTIEEWGIRCPAFTTTVTYELYIYKATGGGAAVKQDGTGGTVNTLLTVNGSVSTQEVTRTINMPVVEEDVLYVECIQTVGTLGTFPLTPVISVRFNATTPGTFNICAHTSAMDNVGFGPVAGNSGTSGDSAPADTTEADVYTRIGPSGLFVDGVSWLLTTAPGGSTTMGLQVRKNSADSSLSPALIAGAAVVGSGGGTSASYSSGDFLSVRSYEAVGVPASSSDSYTLKGRVGTAAINAYQLTQLGFLTGYDEDAEDDPPPSVTSCTGGGTVVSGSNPAAGTSLSTATIPLSWVEITPIGGTTKRYAGIGIPHGTMKEARAQSLGTVKRQLCDADHGYEASVITSTLIDTDGALRALGSTLKGALVDYFTADLATLKAGGTARREFRGILDEWEAQSDRMFSITSVDVLTARLTSIDADDLQTPVGLIDSAISDQNPLERMTDKPLPEPYGAISDENESNPEGVWELKHTGFITLPGEEDLGNNPLFIGSAGAVKNPQSVFGADVLSGDPPVSRIKLGASAFGDWRVNPDAFIWVRNYIVRDGRRYMLMIGKDRHPAVMQAVEGRIPFVMNFCARESVGNTSGTLIDNGGHAIPHWLNASVLQAVGDADWPAQDSFGDYSVLDTATFTAVADILDALGYKFAGVFGGDFQQQSWRDNLADACRSVGAEFYSNRHGQGCLSKLDVSATGSGATAFTTKQILEGSVSCDQKLDACENTVRYLYKRSYKTALADLTPVEGSRLFRDPYDGEWGSGLQEIDDDTSITALGGAPKGIRRSRPQEYYFVRDVDTADLLAEERLALRSPAGGRAEVSFSTLLKYSCDVELGDIVTLEHWDCPWTGSRRCRVLAKETDLDEMEERLTVQDVDDLLA
jgi:hypothetical protein